MSEPEEYDIECPECGAELTVPAEMIGAGGVECPSCGDTLTFEHEGDEEEEERPAPQRRSKPQLRTGGKRRLKRSKSVSGMRRSGSSSTPRSGVEGGRPVIRPPATCGMSIASLICGLLPFFCITPLLAFIFGIVALVQINKSEGKLKGTGMAVAGIILSIFAPIILFVGMLIPAMSGARTAARQVNCQSNLKQIGLAELRYSGEAKGKFSPDLATLAEQGILPPGPVYMCPAAENCSPPTSPAEIRSSNCGYVYLGKGSRDDGPPNTIIAYCNRHVIGGTRTIHILCSDGSLHPVQANSIEEACQQRGFTLPKSVQIRSAR